MDQSRIRNFSIIAHIDHGKSTLADRILELCGAIDTRNKVEQVLDSMDLERERGITIKSQSVRLDYRARDGQLYELNLIDTPGHVDFNYEVSRSLAACEGAVLVVDATQGVEAQTLANVYLALDNNLEIVPVLNKIDLPSANPDGVREQIEDIIGLDAQAAILTSAKDGTGVPELLEAIVQRVPAPRGDRAAPLQALMFDSWFDPYRGVICLVRVFEGTMRKGQKLRMMHNRRVYEVQDVGAFVPGGSPLPELGAGEVGYVVANIKEVRDARVGDTFTDDSRPAAAPLPGFRDVKPMVFAGIFPVQSADYDDVRDGLLKFRLNDAAFTFEPETSQALGFGFRCGFLGLLHMEIVQERLEREFDLSIVTTAPTVVYRVQTKKGETIMLDNPSKLPDLSLVETIEEPFITATIHVPAEHVGGVLTLCEERRGTQKDIRYAAQNRVVITYELPFAEVVFDFYDKLKTISRGYASLDYELTGYRAGDLVRLDLLVSGELVDALTSIVHRDSAYVRGRQLCQKMMGIIPRQQYQVAIQAAIGSRIIARESKPALRKDVTAKCYGGDVTRKRKLLEKQKEGKRRMKKVGHIEIPQEAFLAVLKVE
ncbi:MAG: elongation factor 4 [Deltaproteobacteria bacterium]|nr:elongation factor 4 [Deltaproteobacteria bacterium]